MIRVNLLKPEQKDIRETPIDHSPHMQAEKKQPKIGLIFLLVIMAIILVYYVQDKNLKKEQSLLNNVIEEKRTLQDVAALLVQVEEQKILLERKINLINSLTSHQHVAVNIMDELSLNIPDWVWLVEASYDQNEVRIKGNALSNTLIADYMLSLENSPSFTSVNLISSTQQRSGGDEYLEFSLTARYVLPPKVIPSGEEDTAEEKK
ncbi:PilN domain-containing protein [Acidobacteriota bacterium]